MFVVGCCLAVLVSLVLMAFDIFGVVALSTHHFILIATLGILNAIVFAVETLKHIINRRIK